MTDKRIIWMGMSKHIFKMTFQILPPAMKIWMKWHQVLVVSSEEKLKALTNKVKRPQMALAKERRDEWKVARENQQLQSKGSSVFNKNIRLTKHTQPSREGTKWSADTVRKLKFACGAKGYDLILAQNQPLPSARSLRRYRYMFPGMDNLWWTLVCQTEQLTWNIERPSCFGIKHQILVQLLF